MCVRVCVACVRVRVSACAVRVCARARARVCVALGESRLGCLKSRRWLSLDWTQYVGITGFLSGLSCFRLFGGYGNACQNINRDCT